MFLEDGNTTGGVRVTFPSGDKFNVTTDNETVEK